MKRKYRNTPVVIDGVRFDSVREAKRWRELCLLQSAKKITGLERQVTYELAPAVKLQDSARKKPALRYVADFRYFDFEIDAVVVEDAKGHQTEAFQIKRHLMKSVHGIDVRLS